MRKWMLRRVMLFMVGMLFAAIPGCGHNPNHDIDMEKARAAANRVHSPPKLSEEDKEKLKQDHGG